MDRIAKPATYAASMIDIRNGLSLLIKNKITEISKEYNVTEKLLKSLEETNVYDLAYYFVDRLTGKKLERVSGVIEGQLNIRQSLLIELCELTRPGDVIRMNNSSNLVAIESQKADTLERSLLDNIGMKGVQMKALLTRESIQSASTSKGVQEFIEKNTGKLVEVLQTGQLEFRKYPDTAFSFRIVTVNNDKMFMFLADNPNPDTVAIIYREGNPLLLDQAIDEFDQAWEKAEPLNEEIIGTLTRG